MNRFDRVMTNLNDQLHVPHAEKVKIIAEIASDLESLYRYFKAKGITEEEAERLAINKAIADNAVLEQLQSLNTPKYIRMIEKLPKWVRMVSEMLVFASVLVPLVVIGIYIITIPWLAQRVFVWLMLLTSVPVLYLGCMVIYRFFVLYPYDIGASRGCLRKMLWFGFLAVLVGFDGFLWEVYGASVTIASMTSEVFSYKFLREYFIAGANHLSIGLLLGVIAVFVWIVGSGRLARIEYHEDAVEKIIRQ